MGKVIVVSISVTLLVFLCATLPADGCLGWFFSTQPKENSKIQIKENFNKSLSDAVLKVFQIVIDNETRTNFTCPQPTGIFPHKIDCQAYYTCENSNFTIKNCESDFGFDNETLNCIPKDKVKLCQILERRNDTGVTCTSNGLQPHPIDCHKFVLCVSNVTYTSSCIHGQYFDSKNNVCVTTKDHTDCVNSFTSL